jgi:hypothetical protein
MDQSHTTDLKQFITTLFSVQTVTLTHEIQEIDGRLLVMEERLDNKIDALDKKIDRVDKRVCDLFDFIVKAIDDNSVDIDKRFKAHDKRLKKLEVKFA